ncbi:MAG: ribosomal RNA small subunit methyltransferase A, partial [Spirochaetales bacterium]|nr:ribosomal RNA small subunit methyltransferase A [Spirochaetales bacterium]
MAIWDFDYSSVSSITRLLGEGGLVMTKKFGQNFLISMSALERIVALCGAEEGKRVWEVGPGIGALTTKLLQTGADVTAFEIDHGFCRILREQ